MTPDFCYPDVFKWSELPVGFLHYARILVIDVEYHMNWILVAWKVRSPGSSWLLMKSCRQLSNNAFWREWGRDGHWSILGRPPLMLSLCRWLSGYWQMIPLVVLPHRRTHPPYWLNFLFCNKRTIWQWKISNKILL